MFPINSDLRRETLSMICKQLRINLKLGTQEWGTKVLKERLWKNNINSKTEYPSNLNANSDIILQRDGSQLYSTNLIDNGFQKETWKT